MNRIVITILSALFISGTGYSGEIVRDTLGTRSDAASNVTGLLRGQISGVRVYSADGSDLGAMKVDIRGALNSFGENVQPLWIVDGAEISTSVADNLNAFWNNPGQTHTNPLNPLSFIDAHDIESIEVLKDASATALYGSKAAGGVIIINTRKGKETEGKYADVKANFGVNAGYTPNFNHNYYVSAGARLSGTTYNVSGSFRKSAGAVQNLNSLTGTLKANFDTQANKVVWFGFNALFSIGNHSYPLVPVIGETVTDASRADYDDDSRNYRAVASAYVRFNIIPGLYLKFSGGADFQSATRAVWYGKETAFGAVVPGVNDKGGAAASLYSRPLGYNGEGELNFSRYFSEKHHVGIVARAGVEGNADRFNNMHGFNFTVQYLRARSINMGSYDHLINFYARDYFHFFASGIAAYDYDGIVGLKAGARYDNTPRHPSATGIVYPFGEAFLDLHKAFFKDCNSVSSLRIDGGYGENGHETLLLTDNAQRNDFVLYRNREWHAGLGVGFIRNRLSLNGVFYDRTTSLESDTVCNQGLELGLNARIIETSDWTWTISANVTRNINRVKTSGHSIDAMTSNTAGYSAGSLYGYLADDNGGFKDITGEGIVNTLDRTVLAGTVPEYFGALNTALRFRRFTLNLTLDGAASFFYADIDGVVRDNVIDTEGKYALRSDYVRKGDFIRLSHAGIRYDVPVEGKVVKHLDVKLSYSDTGGPFPLLRYCSIPATRMIMAGASIRF